MLSQDTSWSSCHTLSKLQDVVLTPEKPVRGHPLVVIIKASMSGHAKQVERA